MSPDARLNKAARALASAKLLWADGDFDGACNRAYYAMFDAAHAALAGSGVPLDPATTKTHRGLIAAFGQHLIKPGLLARELGKALNQVERVRLLADYTGEALEEDKVRWAIEQAELFVEAMRRAVAPPSIEFLCTDQKNSVIAPMTQRARLIAYYLPQFHPIPENDQWWGKGFTEWTNVAKAKPLFPGHYQPRIPSDLGFYDLRLPDVRHAQAELAKNYGIEGFCYYHYWFAGRRILERPFNEVIQSGQPDFPFCLCWANHSWSGTWQGKSHLKFIEQTYPGKTDYENHFFFLLKAFTDSRYITVDHKPLFLIWNPKSIPDICQVLEYWRELAHKAGLPGLYLIGINHHTGWRPGDLGLDASTMERMPLKNGNIDSRYNLLKLQKYLLRKPMPTIYAYENMVKYFLRQNSPDFEDYPCVIPNWDNSPRFGYNALVFHDSTPELFRHQLKLAIDRVLNKPYEHKIIFLKAWNEWAEGNYVEPDLMFGHAYLEAIKSEILLTLH